MKLFVFNQIIPNPCLIWSYLVLSNCHVIDMLHNLACSFVIIQVVDHLPHLYPHYLTFFNLPCPATATATTATATAAITLLLLRNASDLRNCTSYFGACMWVWYCRPPIGAHFHPTPQPPPVPQQLGEKAHLRTVAAVLSNATAATLVNN